MRWPGGAGEGEWEAPGLPTGPVGPGQESGLHPESPYGLGEGFEGGVITFPSCLIFLPLQPEMIPWRRKWLSTPVFLPGEFHGQRSLVDYSPWDCKESDITERLTLSAASPSPCPHQMRGAAAAKSLQSCPTLCDPIDCSPPGSSVHGIFQARVLEWGVIAFSRAFPSPLQNSWYLCPAASFAFQM